MTRTGALLNLAAVAATKGLVISVHSGALLSNLAGEHLNLSIVGFDLFLLTQLFSRLFP